MGTVGTGPRFSDAVTAANDMVVFVPMKADCIGVFDVTTSPYSFACHSLPTALHMGNHITHTMFMGGAAATNGKIVFAPHYASCVGGACTQPLKRAHRCANANSALSCGRSRSIRPLR